LATSASARSADFAGGAVEVVIAWGIIDDRLCDARTSGFITDAHIALI
jgi:hypothetical protein